MAKNKSNKKAEKKVEMTNALFATQNEQFKKDVESCKEAGHEVDPTSRQASKYRNKKGVVYLFKSGMIK